MPSSIDTDQALRVARVLIELGIPLFVAQPDDTRRNGFRLPNAWHLSTADPQVVDNWRPGMALCAVTGHGLDLIDIDPRSGGDIPMGSLPPTYATAATPSGGTHYFVLPIGVPSRDGVWPGVDVKSGTPEGMGRGFAFIAPTVRQSKVDGQIRPYIWEREPQPEAIRQGGISQHSGAVQALRARIAELRAERAPQIGAVRRLPQSVARSEWDRAYERLVNDLRTWAANGWGGEAHAGLLAATTHLARLSPEHAMTAYEAAFTAAGVVADPDDLGKMESAIESAVSDVVVPDADMPPQELFWAGASVPEQGGGAQDPPVAGPEHARAGGFHFLDEDELSRIPVPDPLIAGLLWQDSVARLFGPSTVGKTWVGLDLAAHVAGGTSWQGRDVLGSPALYVAAEGGPTIGPRLGYWRGYHGRKTGILVWPEPVLIGGPHWEEFTEACVTAGTRLIVLDTQAAMTLGRKEDSNDDAQLVLAALNSLARATRACVLSIHHNGWAEEGRARGASGMFGGLDTELQLTEGKADGEILLFQRKQRYAEKGKPTRLKLAAHGGGLVVLPPASVGDDAFFGTDDAESRALVEVLHQRGADAGKSLRSLIVVLREDLNQKGSDRVMRRAVHLFKAGSGLPVDLSDSSEL